MKYDNLQVAITTELINSRSVLDICAGTGRWLDDFKGDKIGVEMNVKYHGLLKSKGYRLWGGDASKLSLILMPGIIDSIICIDGIEHLDEIDGLDLINWCENNCKKVLFFTPNEFDSNEINANNLGEPLQKHKSVWPARFWINRGYELIYTEFNQDSKVNNNLYVLVTTKTI